MEIRSELDSKPGQLKGPGPTLHQVRELTLRVESLDTGALRVSTPSARGWAMVVRSQHELSRAVTAAFTEAQCAAYSRWRGERYDLDHLTDPLKGDPLAPPRRRARTKPKPEKDVGWGRNHQRRPDTHPPEAWVKLPNGSWQSPAGYTHGPDTLMGRRVAARRKLAGLHD